MRIILHWLITAGALFFLAEVLPGVKVESFYIALVTALLLGLLNVTLRPILLLLTLPITVLTLGLFALVVNGAMLWILSTVVKGFDITFVAAVIMTIIISLLNWLVNKLVR